MIGSFVLAGLGAVATVEMTRWSADAGRLAFTIGTFVVIPLWGIIAVVSFAIYGKPSLWIILGAPFVFSTLGYLAWVLVVGCWLGHSCL